MIRQPMLASGIEDFNLIRFPAMVSPKLDGYRAVKFYGNLMTKKLKYVRNLHTQKLFEQCNVGLDGELIVGSPYAEDCFRRTSSGVTTRTGEPDVRFYVFDDFNVDDDKMVYSKRLAVAARKVAQCQAEGIPVSLVKHTLVHSLEELFAYEQKCLARGYEGVMIRDPNGPYKQGRSTEKEGWLLKLKRFVDFEALIKGVYPMKHNANEAKINETGYTQRSSHKANKVELDTLGGFECEMDDGTEFNCGMGPGLTADERARLWGIREQLPGQYGKFKSFLIGVKERPRFPKFCGLRDQDDMGTVDEG